MWNFNNPSLEVPHKHQKNPLPPPTMRPWYLWLFLGGMGWVAFFVHSKWIPSFWYNLSPAPTTQLGLDDFWFWAHSHPSHEWLIFLVNVGKYAGDMDPMGLKLDEVGTGCTSSISCNSRWVATKPCPSTTTEASFVGAPQRGKCRIWDMILRLEFWSPLMTQGGKFMKARVC